MMRKQLEKLLLTAILLSSFVCLTQIDAIGKCNGFRYPKELVATSDAVFEGRIIEIRALPEDTQKVRFQVERVWKGSIAEEVTLLKLEFPCVKGRFVIGESYIVFANKRVDDFDTDYIDEGKLLKINECDSLGSTKEYRELLNQLNKKEIDYRGNLSVVVINDRPLVHVNRTSYQSSKLINGMLVVLFYLGIGVIHSWLRYRSV